MARKTVLVLALVTSLAISSVFLLLTLSSFYIFYADIRSIKFLSIKVDNIRLDKPQNETRLSFDILIDNRAEGKIIVVRQESDLFAGGEHIRHRRADFSPNELAIRPYDSVTRHMSMEIPSFKLHLFGKEEVDCRIETSIYIRTPFGQTRISNVHTETLVVTT